MKKAHFKLTHLAVVLILCICLNFCSGGDEDDEEKEPEDSTTPATCIQDIEAVAVGDAVYRYTGGLWTMDDQAPEDELPWFCADFLTADFGWAGGTDYVYHYENGEWTKEDPGMMFSDNKITRIIASPDLGAWAMANGDAESDGMLLRRLPDGEWDVMNLDHIFGGNIVIKDIMALADSGVMALLQETGKRAFLYYIQAEQTGSTNIYTYDPTNFLEFSSLGLTYSGTLVAGGSRIDGINRSGFILYQQDGSVFAPITLPESGCPAQNIKKIFRIGERNFVLGDCSYSVMYLYENLQWSYVSLPGEKSADWTINDFDFTDPNIGWAVGYDGVKEKSIFMLRDTDGWTLNPTCFDPDFEHEDKALYGISAWRSGAELPSQGDDDDTADDDTGADDDDDDDTDA